MAWYVGFSKDVLESAKEFAGNWRKFESFAWSSDAQPRDAEKYAIVYLSHRDSDLIGPWGMWMAS